MSYGRFDYVELPVTDIAAARSFYEQAFGWNLAQFGPSYAATTTGDADLGITSDPAGKPKAPLPIIQVSDLETALDAVTQAGGTIARPIFSFPGGRRCEFLDPSGNRLAVWQLAAD